MTPIRASGLGASLLALTVSAYLPLWDNQFVNFDDELYLANSPGLFQGLTWSGMRWAWTNEVAPYWHPVTWVSFLFDAQFFSHRDAAGNGVLSPQAVHGQNLFWHALNALGLFGWLYSLTGACWRSYLVAALFAVHPMHVESVAWAIERKDVLSGFFGIVTVWSYARYVQRPGKMRYLAVLAAYGLGLLSKPTLITLPFLLILLDYWPLGRLRSGKSAPEAGPGRQTIGPLVREKLPLILMAVASAAITLHQREAHGSIVSLDTLPLSARLANAVASYGWYLSTTLCPTRLAVLYPHPYRDWSVVRVLVGAASVAGISALVWWQRRRRPWLVVGWLWFVFSLLPMTGLAQGGGQSWADRFSYWPHVGLFIALVWVCGDLAGRFRIPSTLGHLGGATVLITLASLTWVQVGYWRTSQTLWEHALAVTQDNERAHQYLSLSYRKEGQLEKADFHQAAAHRLLRKRLRRLP